MSWDEQETDGYFCDSCRDVGCQWCTGIFEEAGDDVDEEIIEDAY